MFRNTGAMSVQPAKSKITAKQIGDSGEWEIPAKKGVNFFMIFGLFFGGIPSLMLFLILFSNVNVESALGKLGMVVFLSPFIAIGFGLAYMGYRMSYTSYKISVRGKAVEVAKVLKGKKQVEKVDAGDVYGIGLYKASETNGRPNYGLFVRAMDGESIKLASGRKEDELRWLASEMMTVLSRQGGLPDQDDLEKNYFKSNEVDGEGVGAERGEFVKASTRMYHNEHGNFVLESNTSKIGLWQVIGGLAGCLFAAVFVWIGFFAEDGDLIFGIVGAVIMSVAFVIFVVGLTKLGTYETFTFEDERVMREKFRSGESKVQIRFPKQDFNKLKVRSSGSVNDDPRYSVVLKGPNEKLKLLGFVDSDVMGLLKIKVNQWLDGKDPEGSEVSNKCGESTGYSGYGESISIDRPDDGVSQAAKLYESEDVEIYRGHQSISDVKGGKWVIRVCLGAFFLAGLGMLVFGVLNLIKAKESEEWEGVDGVITSSEISEHRGEDSTTYGADVTYTYRIKGKEYEGDSVTVSEMSTSNYGRAQKIVAQYPKGDDVTVYYDSSDPSDSVLERGISGGSWISPGVGLAFLIITLLVFIALGKGDKKKSKNL